MAFLQHYLPIELTLVTHTSMLFSLSTPTWWDIWLLPSYLEEVTSTSLNQMLKPHALKYPPFRRMLSKLLAYQSFFLNLRYTLMLSLSSQLHCLMNMISILPWSMLLISKQKLRLTSFLDLTQSSFNAKLASMFTKLKLVSKRTVVICQFSASQ